MAFPHDDKPWADAAAFLRARLKPADRLVAPDPFRFVIPRALRFAQLRGEGPDRFQWIVIHKGELERLPRGFLHAIPAAAVPVHANEVFVVFATAPDRDLADLGETDHVRAFRNALGGLSGAAPAVAEPAREMPPPRIWLTGGPAAGAARERAFQEELDRLVADYLGDAAGLTVLDIGCGGGRVAALLTGAAALTGVDIAEDAVARAEARHGSLPGVSFARMDAARLDFAEASFDLAVMLDLFDLLPDPPAVLAEASRVLARGGRLMLTAANRDALPLRALRRLGQPAPRGGVSVQELAGMLRAVGLVPIRLDGIMLSLGWALPGAGSALASLEEEPEFIEASRLLGRRCGPDHALAIAALARKS